MTGWNLPPGCSESDLPGYHEIEVTIAYECDQCGGKGDMDDVSVDARGSEYEFECPTEGCENLIMGTYESDYWGD